jgi:hypothetical protein
VRLLSNHADKVLPALAAHHHLPVALNNKCNKLISKFNKIVSKCVKISKMVIWPVRVRNAKRYALNVRDLKKNAKSIVKKLNSGIRNYSNKLRPPLNRLLQIDEVLTKKSLVVVMRWGIVFLEFGTL